MKLIDLEVTISVDVLGNTCSVEMPQFPSASLYGEPGSRAPRLQTLSKMVRLRCGSVPCCRELTGCVLGTDAWDARMMLGESVSLSLSVLPEMGLSLSEH